MDGHDGLLDEAILAYRAMMKTIARATVPLWADLELSIAQTRALFAIHSQSPMTVGQVAECLDIGGPTASHLIDRVVQAGLVERLADPADRRRTILRLTPQGEELVSRLLGGVQQMRGWLRRLSEDDLRAYLRGMQAILRVSGVGAGRGRRGPAAHERGDGDATA
jgi:MarR family transcriptional regulator, organic hydroperoxide resistance regulator